MAPPAKNMASLERETDHRAINKHMRYLLDRTEAQLREQDDRQNIILSKYNHFEEVLRDLYQQLCEAHSQMEKMKADYTIDERTLRKSEESRHYVQALWEAAKSQNAKLHEQNVKLQEELQTIRGWVDAGQQA